MLAASLGAPALLAAQRPAPVRPLPFTRFVLPNGLTVILNEDHASPIVAVDIYYRIGSRDDKPGRAGAAHFCEHLMGEGSPSLDRPQSTLYRTLGGTSPHYAATSEDVTHYYVIIPSRQLETVLWAEADRLANRLSMADSQTVASVRGVLAQERLQQIDNIPLGAVRGIMLQAMYPRDNPYFMSGASPLPDLPALTPAALREACLPYYVPNNAVVALSGDFVPATARKWIEKYFASIPRGASVKRQPVAPLVMPIERRIVIEDSRITVPQLRIAWPGAGYAEPDRIPLLALASNLSLARFASDGHLIPIGVEPPAALGRLSKLLIQDRQLATRVIVDNYDLEHTGLFEIDVFPRAGASLSLIETLIDSVTASLGSSPVTGEELARFNNYNTVLLATSLQPRFMRADTLAHDQIFAGDPGAYARQANAARALTSADISRVERKYLKPGRLVVSIVPAGKLDLISKPQLAFENLTPLAGRPPR